jgi:hypothetical protein
MQQSAQDRLEHLEEVIAGLRHDIRGLLTPAALMADLLMENSDPAIQHSGHIISGVVERIVSTLDATYQDVPPRGLG